MRHVLSFDVDGVVADGEYIPVMGRVEGRYEAAKCIGDIGLLGGLLWDFDVYFVSSRSCPNATDLTKIWLSRWGVNLFDVAGVICNVVPTKKADLINLLHATYHFDDDPSIVESMGTKGVLVKCATTKGNTEAYNSNRFRKVDGWWEIYQMCQSLPPLHIAHCPQQSFLEWD